MFGGCGCLIVKTLIFIHWSRLIGPLRCYMNPNTEGTINDWSSTLLYEFKHWRDNQWLVLYAVIWIQTLKGQSMIGPLRCYMNSNTEGTINDWSSTLLYESKHWRDNQWLVLYAVIWIQTLKGQSMIGPIRWYMNPTLKGQSTIGIRIEAILNVITSTF